VDETKDMNGRGRGGPWPSCGRATRSTPSRKMDASSPMWCPDEGSNIWVDGMCIPRVPRTSGAARGVHRLHVPPRDRLQKPAVVHLLLHPLSRPSLTCTPTRRRPTSPSIPPRNILRPAASLHRHQRLFRPLRRACGWRSASPVAGGEGNAGAPPPGPPAHVGTNAPENS
jgi:hypothetical protein